MKKSRQRSQCERSTRPLQLGDADVSIVGVVDRFGGGDQPPFLLHLGFDAWQDVRDRLAEPLGLGISGVPFPRSELHASRELEFTRYYVDARRREGHDHAIALAHDVEASARNHYRRYAPGR